MRVPFFSPSTNGTSTTERAPLTEPLSSPQALYLLELDIYHSRLAIESAWRRLAQRTYQRTHTPTLLLALKEFQRTCPNLPPTRPA